MKEKFTREKIGEKAYFSTVNIDKFNTSRISVNFIVDLNRDTVTANSLVAFLLRKGCRMYPDFTALNLRLDELYGAVISTDTKKLGDSQVINITGVCINDSFALEGEGILSKLAELIRNMLTEPLMENGLFLQKEIAVEKNVLGDTIRAIRDDKGAYVIERLIADMCAEEPFGLPKYGYYEDIDKLSAEFVTKCYKDILEHSKVEIICSGRSVDSKLKEVFAKAFSTLDRSRVSDVDTKPTSPANTPHKVEEKLNIIQSKVALGFASGIRMIDEKSAAFRLMNAVYGGTVSSKLFTNVREKMNLCYYCASTLDRYKGTLLAYSGVEEKNRQKAIDEMLRELEEIRKGNVTSTEIEQARAALITGLGSVRDSLFSLESWYLGQILCETSYTPENEIELLERVTREDVVCAANAFKLNTVYSIVDGGAQ